MTDRVTIPAPDAGAALADLVEGLAAIGRSMQDFSTRVTPRPWLARLLGRRAPTPAPSITGGSDA